MWSLGRRSLLSIFADDEKHNAHFLGKVPITFLAGRGTAATAKKARAQKGRRPKNRSKSGGLSHGSSPILFNPFRMSGKMFIGPGKVDKY
jgi:hypothetical protein